MLRLLKRTNAYHRIMFRQRSAQRPFSGKRSSGRPGIPASAYTVTSPSSAASEVISAPVLDNVSPIYIPPPPPPTTYALKAPSVNAYPSGRECERGALLQCTTACDACIMRPCAMQLMHIQLWEEFVDPCAHPALIIKPRQRPADKIAPT